MSQDVIEYLPPQELVILDEGGTHSDAIEDTGLAASIKEFGIKSPIRARKKDGKAIVIYGRRRTRAALSLGMREVPVIFESDQVSDLRALELEVIENFQRLDLNPVAKAEAIQKLMNAGNSSATQVAKKLGLSAPSIAKLQPILQLPEPIKNQVAWGEIPASAAYELAKVSDPAKQAELAGRLAAGTLTRDGVAAARKSKPRTESVTVKTKSVRVTAMLSADRSIAVSAPGLTLERLIEQLEELLGKARRIRTQGVELATFIKMLADQAKLHP